MTDQNHVRAVELAEQIETNRTHLVTTQAILLEIGNALNKWLACFWLSATEFFKDLDRAQVVK